MILKNLQVESIIQAEGRLDKEGKNLKMSNWVDGLLPTGKQEERVSKEGAVIKWVNERLAYYTPAATKLLEEYYNHVAEIQRRASPSSKSVDKLFERVVPYSRAIHNQGFTARNGKFISEIYFEYGEHIFDKVWLTLVVTPESDYFLGGTRKRPNLYKTDDLRSLPIEAVETKLEELLEVVFARDGDISYLRWLLQKGKI